MGHIIGTVQESMSSPAETVTRDTSVATASQVVATNEIGSLVVTGGTQLGVVTKTDLLSVVAGEGDPETTSVRAVTFSPVVTIAPDAPLSKAASRMDKNGIKHLIVVNDGPVGVLTTTDVVAALAPDTEALVNEFLPAE